MPKKSTKRKMIRVASGKRPAGKRTKPPRSARKSKA